MAGPPSEASLHLLFDKADEAIDKCRWARAADLFKRAALEASVLCPQDLLVTVELQHFGASSLQSQGDQPGVSIADQRALNEEAWALVRQGMEVVSRRHASDTLGYNKCRPDEVQYVTRRATSHIVDAAQRARRLEAVTSMASCFGVSVAILLARICLYRLHCRFFDIPLPPLAGLETGLAEQFVFRALDYLASVRAVTALLTGDAEFVNTIQQLLASRAMEPSFRAALEARWMSPDVVASLCRRGAIARSTAFVNTTSAEREAAQRADVAEHGLLVCAFPGCESRRRPSASSKCVPRAGRWRTAARSTGGCTGRGATRMSARTSKQRAPSRRARCEVTAWTPAR